MNGGMAKGQARFQSAPTRTSNTTANSQQSFTVISPDSPGFAPGYPVTPGTVNDSAMIRATLSETIRKSGKSRENIADEMSALTGTEVTVRRLNAFTAESREDYHFPLDLVRAFCAATMDYTLLYRIAEMSGFSLIDQTESELIELGREYLRQKRAHERIAEIEKRLQGVDL